MNVIHKKSNKYNKINISTYESVMPINVNSSIPKEHQRREEEKNIVEIFFHEKLETWQLWIF